jgi:hypothetical protein
LVPACPGSDKDLLIYHNFIHVKYFVTFQYVQIGPLRHPVIFFQYGQNLPLRAPNSAPRTGSKISVSINTNMLQSTICAVRVYVSRPKRLQTVARF